MGWTNVIEFLAIRDADDTVIKSKEKRDFSIVMLTPTADGVRIALKVVPGASRDRVVGALGDALKVAVTKPPEGGAANRAVVQLLAKAMRVATAQVEIVKGPASPRKEVRVSGLTLLEVRERLDEHLRSRDGHFKPSHAEPCRTR